MSYFCYTDTRCSSSGPPSFKERRKRKGKKASQALQPFREKKTPLEPDCCQCPGTPWELPTRSDALLPSMPTCQHRFGAEDKHNGAPFPQVQAQTRRTLRCSGFITEFRRRGGTGGTRSVRGCRGAAAAPVPPHTLQVHFWANSSGMFWL